MRLILVLGDQLSDDLSALRLADPTQDVVVMAEVMAEGTYVPHHPQKIGLVLTAPIFLIAMSGMLPVNPFHSLDMRLVNWVQLVLATPVVLWCGWPFFERGWSSIRLLSPNMFTLIAIGVGAAFVYSLFATLVPGVFPEGIQMADGAVEPYFDTAAVVTVLVLLGQVLEIRARPVSWPASVWRSALRPTQARPHPQRRRPSFNAR